LMRVRAPTLLIVGGNDIQVIELNRAALAQLRCEKQLVIVPGGATHLFEEPGALDEVARLAREWFQRHLNTVVQQAGGPAGKRRTQARQRTLRWRFPQERPKPGKPGSAFRAWITKIARSSDVRRSTGCLVQGRAAAMTAFHEDRRMCPLDANLARTGPVSARHLCRIDLRTTGAGELRRGPRSHRHSNPRPAV
jgi:hypothetical protein